VLALDVYFNETEDESRTQLNAERQSPKKVSVQAIMMDMEFYLDPKVHRTP
jgi:hypothetical protein